MNHHEEGVQAYLRQCRRCFKMTQQAYLGTAPDMQGVSHEPY